MPTPSFAPVFSCRCCGQKSLQPYLDLGKTPLANSYTPEPQVQEAYPLQVNFCSNCSHSQLSITVRPDLLYKNYLYVSGTTETFRKHQRALAVDAVRRVQQHEGHYLQALDIAANDGSQMEAFQELGAIAYGVDPAENLWQVTKDKGLNVLCCYWNEQAGFQIGAQRGAMDIITATNVFAHVDDPYGFLKGCKHALAAKGIVVIEFPYGKNIVRQNQFDQWYHEHLSGFTVKSMMTLAHRCGFRIHDAVQTPIHGGSIRFILKRDTWLGDDSVLAHELVDQERAQGLHSLQSYLDFAARVNHNLAHLELTIEGLAHAGYLMVGYGASAKGNTLLNATDIHLDYIVDDNPLKHGYYTPGRNIPIVSPTVLEAEERPMVHLLTAWNFQAEIRKNIRARRGRRGLQDQILLYIPEVNLQPLYESPSKATLPCT